MKHLIIHRSENAQLSDIRSLWENEPGFSPSLVIAYVSPHLDFNAVVYKYSSDLGDIPFLAIMTAGELCQSSDDIENRELDLYGQQYQSPAVVFQIFNKSLLSDVSLHEVPLYSEDIKYKKIEFNISARISMIERECEAIELPFCVRSDDSFALTYIDGLSNSENFLLEAIYKTKKFPCMFIGGSSGGALDFEHSYMAINGRVVTDSALIAFCKMAKGKRFSPFKTQSGVLESAEYCIVVEASNELRGLKSVLDMSSMRVMSMQDYLCMRLSCEKHDLKEAFTGYDLAIQVGGEVFLRSIGAFDEEGKGVTLFCDVNVGDKLYLVKDSSFVDKTRQDLLAYFKGKSKPIAGILNDCIQRRVNNANVLDQSNDFFDMPVAGFSTFGEVFGININNTLSALFFYDIGEDEVFYDDFMNKFAIHFASFMNFYSEQKLNRDSAINQLRNIVAEKVAEYLERSIEISELIQQNLEDTAEVGLDTIADLNEELLHDAQNLNMIISIVDKEEKKSSDRELSSSELLYDALCTNIELNFKIHDYIQSLKKSKSDAINANQAKSSFLANMSHELRTPLNSIMGFARMLIEDKALSHDNKQMASTINKSASNLLEIVNDILDISKVEAGNMTLERIGFDFKNILSNIIDTMAPIASSKNVTLKYTYTSQDIPYLLGDPLRLGHVVTNLISNAIKYTQEGEVFVHVGLENIDAQNVNINFQVRDTGIGIPPEKQKIIFDKFTQADETTTRRFGGTGLGLAITRDLVELMGGEIGVESEVGYGSCFYFNIPFEISNSIDDVSQDAWKKHRKHEVLENRVSADIVRILVAEDHLLNQEFIVRLLKKIGIKNFDLVENGALALEKLQQNQYDLVLMDCHMPEKNGYETTKHIRAEEELSGEHIPIVALTADAMKGAQDRCLEVGMDDYVSKPIDKDEFLYVLEQWIIFPDVTNEEPKAVSHESAADEGQSKEDEAPVDMNYIYDYVDTPEGVANIVQVFFGQSEECIEILKDQCVDGENKEWMEASHKLKGGAGMIGALRLHKLSEASQEMLEADVSEREHMFNDICAEYQKVKSFLEGVNS